MDVRLIRDVLDVAPVRKLDCHAQNFVNVVECVIEHKFPFFVFLLRFWFIIIAPTIIIIDHLLKTFNFAKKEAPGSEKKTS